MAIKKPTRKKQPPEKLRIHTMSLSSANASVLASLAQEASDQIGRTISTSAVLRAILNLTEKGLLPAREIVTAIEAEVNTGRIWGTTTKQQRTLPTRTRSAPLPAP